MLSLMKLNVDVDEKCKAWVVVGPGVVGCREASQTGAGGRMPATEWRVLSASSEHRLSAIFFICICVQGACLCVSLFRCIS